MLFIDAGRGDIQSLSAVDIFSRASHGGCVCMCVLFLSGTYITRSDVQHVASLRGLAAPLNYQVTETI